jgi:hypothetical protein
MAFDGVNIQMGVFNYFHQRIVTSMVQENCRQVLFNLTFTQSNPMLDKLAQNPEDKWCLA